MNPDQMTDAEFREWFVTAPTEASVEAEMRTLHRKQAAKERAAVIADWRVRHPTATCRDDIAWLMADLEQRVARETA